MKITAKQLRRVLAAGGLLAGLAASSASALADGPATPLQRGASAGGTLVNQGGGGVGNYTVNGDGNDVAVNVTFMNGATFLSQSAFVTVWGPTGEVAAPTTVGNAATTSFQTKPDQSYTVVVAVYQPISQTDFTIAVN